MTAKQIYELPASTTPGEILAVPVSITGNLTRSTTPVVAKSAANTSVTIADDAAASFTPPRAIGVIFVIAPSGANSGIVHYNTGTPTTAAMQAGANVNVTTGALTGTTGTDAKVTVSAHTDGKVYIENRSGGSLAFLYSFA